MRRWKSVLFVLVALCVVSADADARRIYTIRQGDTPDGIRFKLAPSLEELRAANPKVNFSLLRVDDEIVDSRPELADIKKAEQQIANLTEKLGAITTGRNTLMRELGASRGLNVTLDEKVRELQPLADLADSYRARLWLWTGSLVGVCVFLLGISTLQARVHSRLDRKILDLQQEVVYARLDSVMVRAPSQSNGVSRSRHSDADTTPQRTH